MLLYRRLGSRYLFDFDFRRKLQHLAAVFKQSLCTISASALKRPNGPRRKRSFRRFPLNLSQDPNIVTKFRRRKNNRFLIGGLVFDNDGEISDCRVVVAHLAIQGSQRKINE